jgi:hypothetical protein
MESLRPLADPCNKVLARGTRRGRSLLPWAAKSQTMALAGPTIREKILSLV